MVSINEFCKMLEKDRQCNFVALAITYLQANSIDATIKYLQAKGVEINGYILIASHKVTGMLLDESMFLCRDNPNIKFIEFDYTSTEKFGSFQKISNKLSIFFDSKKKSKNDIYIAWIDIDMYWVGMLKNITPKKVTYILLDDGGGSYANKYDDIVHLIQYGNNGKKNGLKVRLKKIKVYLNCLFRDIIINRMKKTNRIIWSTIFHKVYENGSYKLVPNSDLTPFYVDTLGETGKALDERDINVLYDSALFNTQCLVENKITDGVIDYELYKKCSLILKKHSIDVVIKPHPREMNKIRYNEIADFVYEGNGYSQEVLLARGEKKPKCIISIFSSTLLNAYGLFGIKAISLAKIVLREEISEGFREQLSEFIELYGDLFFFPETLEEFENMVKEL